MNTGRTGLRFGFLRLAARELCPAENHGEIIRALGFGRYRKATEGIRRLKRIPNDEFRVANAGKGGTTKDAKDANGKKSVLGGAGLERGVAGGGGYRQLAAVEKNIFGGFEFDFQRAEQMMLTDGTDGIIMEIVAGGKSDLIPSKSKFWFLKEGLSVERGEGRLGVEGKGCESTVDTWGAYLYFLFVNTVRMPRIYSSGIFIAVVRTGMFAEHKMGPEWLRVK